MKAPTYRASSIFILIAYEFLACTISHFFSTPFCNRERLWFYINRFLTLVVWMGAWCYCGTGYSKQSRSL